MQKVVGSSPIIRSESSLVLASLSCASANEHDVAHPADEPMRSASEGKAEMEGRVRRECEANTRAGVQACFSEREPCETLA